MLYTLLLVLLPGAPGLYVPGVAPADLGQEEDVPVKAVKMTSAQTQLPYEYYSLEFCKPRSGVVQYFPQNLGQIIRGERVVDTPYMVNMAVNTECQVLCQDKVWDSKAGEVAGYRIEHEYSVHLMMDNLPCATRFTMPDTGEVQYEPGYRLGYTSSGKNYVNNHLKFLLKYHLEEDSNTYRVVGFIIEAMSIEKSGLDIKSKSFI